MFFSLIFENLPHLPAFIYLKHYEVWCVCAASKQPNSYFILFGMRNHIHLLLLKFYKFHTFRQQNVSAQAKQQGETALRNISQRWMDYPQQFKLLFAHINRNEKHKKNERWQFYDGMVAETATPWIEPSFFVFIWTFEMFRMNDMAFAHSFVRSFSVVLCAVFNLWARNFSITSGTIRFS